MTKQPKYSDLDSFYRTLIDNMQIGVIVANGEGILTYINKTYARFLNVDEKSAIGIHATDLVSNTRLHIVARTGQAEINYPHKHKGVTYLVHRVPIKENDKVVAVMGLVLFDNATTAVELAGSCPIWKRS